MTKRWLYEAGSDGTGAMVEIRARRKPKNDCTCEGLCLTMSLGAAAVDPCQERLEEVAAVGSEAKEPSGR